MKSIALPELDAFFLNRGKLPDLPEGTIIEAYPEPYGERWRYTLPNGTTKGSNFKTRDEAVHRARHAVRFQIEMERL